MAGFCDSFALPLTPMPLACTSCAKVGCTVEFLQPWFTAYFCDCFALGLQVEGTIAKSFGQKELCEVSKKSTPIMTARFRLGQQVELELWLCQFSIGQSAADEARELGRVVRSHSRLCNTKYLVIGGSFNTSPSSSDWCEMMQVMRPVSEAAEPWHPPLPISHAGDHDNNHIWVYNKCSRLWGSDVRACTLLAPAGPIPSGNARMTRGQAKAAAVYSGGRLLLATFPVFGKRKAY